MGKSQPGQQRGKQGKNANQKAKKKKKGHVKQNPPTPGGRVVKPKYVKGGIAKAIRSVDRLLSKPDLDPEMRASQERKRADLEVQMAEQKQHMLERKMAVRYHKVRFFERVKMERRVTQLNRVARKCKEKHQPLPEGYAEELAQAKADMRYTTHFPKGEKYVSLLKDAETPEAQAHLEQQRARLRAIVQRAAEEEALLGEGDEGRALKKKAIKEAKWRERKAAKAKALAEAEAAAGGEPGAGDDFFLEENGGGKKGGKRQREEASSKDESSEEEEDEEEEESSDEEAAGGDKKSSSSGESSSEEEEESGEERGEEAPSKKAKVVQSAEKGAPQGKAPRREGETEKERKARWKLERKQRARAAKRERASKRRADKAAGVVSGKAAKKMAKKAAKGKSA